MPYLSHATARLPAARSAGLLVVALALSSMATPAQSADAPAKPAVNTTVRIKAAPPSIQVDSTSEAAKDDTAAAASQAKQGHSHARSDSSEDDFDIDAFNGEVKKMPWLIGLIFLVVSSIFLAPVILLIGIIWYKLRKTRLQNEAMLALAAKGVVPPAQAADALAASVSPANVAPQLYQQAVALRRRVAWSDLRKGVILSMIGLAFLLYAITANGESSWVGLICLFLGGGYVALWWLEGRHLEQASATRTGNGTGTGSGG